MLEKILTASQLPIWAEEYALSVAAAFHPDCIILFGSVARAAQRQDSDIDILVIGGDLPANQRERFRLLMRLRPWLAPIQVQSYTRPEWDEMMAGKHVTVLEALQDGRALHGQRLFARWRRQFRRWQSQGLRRTDCTWVIPPVRSMGGTDKEQLKRGGR
jgi:predicted nucleotidyltransferase